MSMRYEFENLPITLRIGGRDVDCGEFSGRFDLGWDEDSTCSIHVADICLTADDGAVIHFNPGAGTFEGAVWLALAKAIEAAHMISIEEYRAECEEAMMAAKAKACGRGVYVGANAPWR